jgi:hypothetical protein
VIKLEILDKNRYEYRKPDILRYNLVGGAITILKNDGLRQWEG